MTKDQAEQVIRKAFSKFNTKCFAFEISPGNWKVAKRFKGWKQYRHRNTFTLSLSHTNFIPNKKLSMQYTLIDQNMSAIHAFCFPPKRV
jgi:hypothetical protein